MFKSRNVHTKAEETKPSSSSTVQFILMPKESSREFSKCQGPNGFLLVFYLPPIGHIMHDIRIHAGSILTASEMHQHFIENSKRLSEEGEENGGGRSASSHPELYSPTPWLSLSDLNLTPEY